MANNGRKRDVLPGTPVLLAMKEEWIGPILCGRKRAEVRRRAPKPGNEPRRVYLYSRGHVYGYADVVGYCHVTFHNWKRLCRKYHTMALLSRDAMEQYIVGTGCGIVYMLGTAVRFNRAVPVPFRPQSWQYLTPDMENLILTNGGTAAASFPNRKS